MMKITIKIEVNKIIKIINKNLIDNNKKKKK
jgi:hypothetical protein